VKCNVWRLPFCLPAIPPYVLPAQAGIHPYAANPGPGGDGLAGRRDRHGDDVCGVGRGARIAFAKRAVPCGWSATWQARRPPFRVPTNPQHVIPAQAGNHPDAANPGPGGDGPVGRRDRRGDDVCGVGGGACIAFAERAAPCGWSATWQARRLPFRVPTNPQHVIPVQAGNHPDAANPGPGGDGLVGRRDRHGDDVGGVGRGACIAFAERAVPCGWSATW